MNLSFRHSEELEKRLLASLLVNTTPLDVKQRIVRDLTAGDFYSTAHQQIFEIAAGMFIASGGFTWAQIHDELSSVLAPDGLTLGFVAKTIWRESAPIHDGVPGQESLYDIVSRVRAYAQSRSAHKECLSLVNRVTDEAYIDIPESIATCATKLMRISEAGLGTKQKEPTQLADEVVDEAVQPVAADRIPTGLHYLDRTLHGGLAPSTMTVIGGRRGTGKSSFGVHILVQALRQSKSVVFVALEMSAKQMMARIVPCMSGVRLVYRSGDLYTAEELDRLNAAKQEIAAIPPQIIDTPMTIAQIEATAARLVSQNRMDLLIVDYLQLVGFDRKAESQQVGITQVAQGLKHIALRHHIPVVALAQIRRESQGDKGPPTLAGLKGSGSIEEAADHVLLIWPKNQGGTEIECSLAKNRHGPGVHFPINANWALMRLFEADIGGEEER